MDENNNTCNGFMIVFKIESLAMTIVGHVVGSKGDSSAVEITGDFDFMPSGVAQTMIVSLSLFHTYGS